MTHPYLIPSSPDAQEFVAALERAVLDGRPVELERLASGNNRYAFKARIVSVIPAEDRCLVLVDDEAVPRSYWIRYLFRIIDADGIDTGNRAALARHQEILDRRVQREADGQRALGDTNFVPAPTFVTSSSAGKTTGSLNGMPCEFFVFRGYSSKPALAVVYAKNEQAAVRCMQLLDSANSTWDVFASYLQAHFIWPAWLNVREEVQMRATKMRAGLPRLLPDAGWDIKHEREALYKSHGLGYDELGPLASVFSLEGEQPDLYAIFALAERVPAPLLNLYLVVAFDSVQFFDDLDRVDDVTLERFIHYGLAAEQQVPTAQQALETMTIAKLRELVVLAGTGFKARGSAAIREHLQGHLTPALEHEAV